MPRLDPKFCQPIPDTKVAVAVGAAAGKTLNEALTDKSIPLGGAFDSGSAPIGTIMPWAHSVLPTNGDWILADGSAVSQTTYADLYALIGSTYNTGGEGAGNFRLPDLRGRTFVGAGQGSGLSVRTLGQYLGAEAHALAEGEMPAHNHALLAPANVLNNALTESNHLAWIRDAGNDYSAGLEAAGTGTTPSKGLSSSKGSGTAHNNMQPSLVGNWLIRWRVSQVSQLLIDGSVPMTGSLQMGTNNILGTAMALRGVNNLASFSFNDAQDHENSIWSLANVFADLTTITGDGKVSIVANGNDPGSYGVPKGIDLIASGGGDVNMSATGIVMTVTSEVTINGPGVHIAGGFLNLDGGILDGIGFLKNKTGFVIDIRAEGDEGIDLVSGTGGGKSEVWIGQGEIAMYAPNYITINSPLLDMTTGKVVNVGTPTDPTDAATKAYVDSKAPKKYFARITGNGPTALPVDTEVVLDFTTVSNPDSLTVNSGTAWSLTIPAGATWMDFSCSAEARATSGTGLFYLVLWVNDVWTETILRAPADTNGIVANGNIKIPVTPGDVIKLIGYIETNAGEVIHSADGCRISAFLY